MTNRNFAAIIVLFFSLTPFSVPQAAPPPSADVEKRVDAILNKMTLEEKITIIGGINDFYTRPIPRLGILSLRMSDGPLGVHDYGPAAAYPAGIQLRSTFTLTR